MSRTKTMKAFDCVEFRRKVQAEIFEEIRGLTHQEQIDYFNQQAQCGRIGKW